MIWDVCWSVEGLRTLLLVIEMMLCMMEAVDVIICDVS